jgi:hypothetical protein
VPSLRDRERGLGRPTLDQHLGLDRGQMTSCIEHLTNRVTAVQQQQWMTHEAADIDHACAAKLQGRGARRQNLIRTQCAAPEAPIATLVVSDYEVNLTTFQQRQLLVA